MSKEIKGFITRDDFQDSSIQDVAPVYRLSQIGYTYSKAKQQYYSSNDSLYSLQVFRMINGTVLTQSEANRIIDVVIAFSEYLTASIATNRQQTILFFVNNYNQLNPSHQISGFSYNNQVNYNNIKTVDFITFTVDDVICSLWLSDDVFKAFYPEYDINVVLPFTNLGTIANNPSLMISALDSFSFPEFNRRLDEDKNGIPPTHTVVMDLPYKVPNTSVLRSCHFGFNIYGTQGNYAYILKLKLYAYMTETLGLTTDLIEEVFPSILNINEFFIVPRWDNVAIPSQVGQTGIGSQISKAFSQVFDIGDFITVYDNDTFMTNNTYNVPVDYNNLLLNVVNGYYSDESLRDFKTYYSDLISVPSSHLDFGRMSERTQQFLIMLESALEIANSSTSTELFNRTLQETGFPFTIITRGGVTYLSIFFKDHQYYVIPKYEYLRLV